MELSRIALAALAYPGVLTALVAGALFGLLSGRLGGLPRLAAALDSREGLAAAFSIALSGLALAMLPWPLHPAPAGALWLWSWAAFELAFLMPLTPALLAGAPSVVRAAIREAQLGVLTRALLWTALAIALVAHGNWGTAALPAHILALVLALATLPAALGRGPFAAESSVTPEGTQAGLPDHVKALDTWARTVRGGALLAATLLATLPVGIASPWVGLGMIVAGMIVYALLLRRLEGRLPRMTLPAALRLYALWGLPVVALASLALALIGAN